MKLMWIASALYPTLLLLSIVAPPVPGSGKKLLIPSELADERKDAANVATSSSVASVAAESARVWRLPDASAPGHTKLRKPVVFGRDFQLKNKEQLGSFMDAFSGFTQEEIAELKALQAADKDKTHGPKGKAK